MKANLSNIMKESHEIARQHLVPGNYRQNLSYGMRIAWLHYKNSLIINSLEDYKWLMTGLTESYPNTEKRSAYRTLSGIVEDKELTGFAADVAETVNKYHRCSSKQLYVIARGMYESGRYFIKNGMLYDK